MAVPETKPVFKRDASGRTMDQRSVKIDSAIKQGNTAYRLSQMPAGQLGAKPASRSEKGSAKGK